MMVYTNYNGYNSRNSYTFANKYQTDKFCKYLNTKNILIQLLALELKILIENDTFIQPLLLIIKKK